MIYEKRIALQQICNKTSSNGHDMPEAIMKGALRLRPVVHPVAGAIADRPKTLLAGGSATA